MSDARARLRAGLRAIWIKSLPHVRDQLNTLEEFAAALRAGGASAEQQETVLRETHRLVGSAGSFGFQEGTRLASELELMLGRMDTIDVTRVTEIVAELRSILDTDVLPES